MNIIVKKSFHYDPWFKDYREILLANFPNWQKDKFVVADQYSIKGKRATPLNVDGQMMEIVNKMRADFKLGCILVKVAKI